VGPLEGGVQKKWKLKKIPEAKGMNSILRPGSPHSAAYDLQENDFKREGGELEVLGVLNSHHNNPQRIHKINEMNVQ